MVVFRKDVSVAHVHCIDTDREGGMYQVTKLLISLNHTDIAYLAGSSDSEYSYARLRGIQRALTEADLALKPEFHRGCLPTIDDGFRVTTNLLHLPSGKCPSAIIAL